MGKIETEKIQKLSSLLNLQEKLLERCDQLNPWGSSTKDKKTFCDACCYGGFAIVRLHEIDNKIISNSHRLKALSELKFDGLTNFPKDSKAYDSFVQLWGQALELNEGLKNAVEFCCSLVNKKEKLFGDENYRVEFKEHSQQLAGVLFYDLLDILATYEPTKYPNLRLQVICSYLKAFRESFIWNANVRGPCRSDRIPDECRPKNPPANLKGEALVRLGNRQHEFTFFTSTGDFEWLINNTGLKNYKAMLDEVWDVSTGQLRDYPGDSNAVWVIQNREYIKILNDGADNICELLKPLSAKEEYRRYADKVRANIRYEGRPWTTLNVPWSYLDQLDKIIVELDSTSAGAQEPAETEPKTTPVKKPTKAKRGRQQKYTVKFLQKVKETFDRHCRDTDYKTQSWQLAADECNVTSGKAAYMACKRAGLLKGT